MIKDDLITRVSSLVFVGRGGGRIMIHVKGI